MTATTITSLPKNKTGIYAGNTLQENKTTRNQTNTIPSLSLHQRHNDSIHLLLTTIEQNRVAKGGLQPHYPIDGNSSVTYDSFSTTSTNTNGLRNGFRPSTVRRQRSRITTAMSREKTSQDLKDNSSKQVFTPSPASAKLKSEIDQLNSQLKLYGELNKTAPIQGNREVMTTPRSVLSNTTAYRLTSASTNHTTARMHQRISSSSSSTAANRAVAALHSYPSLSDIYNKGAMTPSTPIPVEGSIQNENNTNMTHAFQIPQQTNIGNESILPNNPVTRTTYSRKLDRFSNETKTISCPFYVMYFTHLAMQQGTDNELENKRVASSISTASTSRRGTSLSRQQSSRRALHSPVSYKTYSTVDDDNDSIINTTTYYTNKRFSAKIAAFENENSHLLKDVLRTTSWNHVQV